MIAGQGLVRTGAHEPAGRQLARRWAQNPRMTFLFALVLAAILSAFVNNAPVVILLLPILISVSMKTDTPAPGLLVPMGLPLVLLWLMLTFILPWFMACSLALGLLVR